MRVLRMLDWLQNGKEMKLKNDRIVNEKCQKFSTELEKIQFISGKISRFKPFKNMMT